MRIHKSLGNGDCLFHSCAFFLGINHRRLRSLVAKIMREYPYLPISGVPLSTWLEEAGYDSSYPDKVDESGFNGSAIELSLISIMFRRSIYVLKRNPKFPGGFEQIAEYFPEFGDGFSLLWSGNHYDSLID